MEVLEDRSIDPGDIDGDEESALPTSPPAMERKQLRLWSLGSTITTTNFDFLLSQIGNPVNCLRP